MNDRRLRWERLQQRWVVGELLSAAQERERLEGAQDPSALGELRFYEQWRRWLDETPEVEVARNAQLVDEALKQSTSARGPGLRLVEESAAHPERAPRARRSSAPIWLLTGLVASAIGLGLYLSQQPAPTAPKGPLVAATGAVATCELTSLSGEVEAAGHGAVIGAILYEGETVTTAAGRACMTVDRTMRVCLPGDSRLTITSLRQEDIRLQVERGASLASLSARPPGSIFSLTGHGVVATAHGTVFALALTGAARGAEVTVFEGTVEVSGPTDRELVNAGKRVGFDDRGQRLAQVAVDDAMNERWLDWLPAPTLGKSAPATDDSASATDKPPPASPAAANSGAGLSQEALFAAARKEAGLGNIRTARALYREIVTRFPGPGTAAVQVNLGNLEMKLGAPQRALTAFETYLRSDGALAPEALHGKARALRALGRSADERATIRAYLARYPSGFQAPTLRRRLAELE